MRALLFCLALLALAPGAALASDGAGSNSDSSGDSSDGSGGTSMGSGESSQNTGDSSDTEDDSSERSSEDSSKDSTDGSTDATSKGESGRAFTIAAVIVVVAAGVAAGVGFGITTTRNNRAESEQQLARFLRRHHSAVVHEVALARGPIIEGWAAEWGFDAGEVERFLEELDGSEEQVALIEAMSELQDPTSARRFAVELHRVMERTAGAERVGVASTKI